MSLPEFEIELRDEAVDAYFAQLIERMANRRPITAAIAQVLQSETDENFEQQGRPKWAPLHPGYAALVAGRGKMLNRSGASGLKGSIQTEFDNDGASIGTNKVYGAIHQIGGKTAPHTITPVSRNALRFTLGGRVVLAKKVNHPGSKIPARPYLPFTGDGVLQATARESIIDLIGQALQYPERPPEVAP